MGSWRRAAALFVSATMNLFWTKIVTLVLLGVLPFLVGASVLPLRRLLSFGNHAAKRRHEFIASILLCFGAGVLMATSFVHILPESREGMLEVQESLGIECLPEVVFCGGFFLVYFIECLIHLVLSKSVKSRKCLHQSLSPCNTIPECPNPVLPREHSEDHEESPLSSCEVKSSKACPKEVNSVFSTAALRNFVTALALSSHSLLEGLAVGVEKHVKDVWALFIAISLHKCVIAFCMCLELIQSGTSMLLFILYVAAFCLMSPIGIGIGIGISEVANSEYHEFTVSFLQALSGGSIIYCVMFEIIQRERQKDVSGMLQLFGMFIGFVGMLALEAHSKCEEEVKDSSISFFSSRNSAEHSTVS